MWGDFVATKSVSIRIEEEMLDKIIKTANRSDKELVFEIGSNSDLILENMITRKFSMDNRKFCYKGRER